LFHPTKLNPSRPQKNPSKNKKVVLGAMPPGFLDYKGRDLRDKLDACLERNMWLFSIAGILITFPICVRYKTERPLFAAAITCPVLDMIYGTIRCDREKEEFSRYYKQLQRTWNDQTGRHEPARLQQQDGGDGGGADGGGGRGADGGGGGGDSASSSSAQRPWR
jgi:uncharacterized membrane protein YgcG